MATIDPYLQAQAARGDRYARAQIAFVRQQQANQGEAQRKAQAASDAEKKKAHEDAKSGALEDKPSAFLSMAERDALEQKRREERQDFKDQQDKENKKQQDAARKAHEKDVQENPDKFWQERANQYDGKIANTDSSILDRAAALEARNRIYSDSDNLTRRGQMADAQLHPSAADQYAKERQAETDKAAKAQADKIEAYKESVIEWSKEHPEDAEAQKQADAIKASRYQEARQALGGAQPQPQGQPKQPVAQPSPVGSSGPQPVTSSSLPSSGGINSPVAPAFSVGGLPGQAIPVSQPDSSSPVQPASNQYTLKDLHALGNQLNNLRPMKEGTQAENDQRTAQRREILATLAPWQRPIVDHVATDADVNNVRQAKFDADLEQSHKDNPSMWGVAGNNIKQTWNALTGGDSQLDPNAPTAGERASAAVQSVVNPQYDPNPSPDFKPISDAVGKGFDVTSQFMGGITAPVFNAAGRAVGDYVGNSDFGKGVADVAGKVAGGLGDTYDAVTERAKKALGY